MDVEKWVRAEDIQLECSCASRTCGPHRCKPALWAWCWIAVLLVCLMIMLIFWAEEKKTWQGDLTKAITKQSLREVQEVLPRHKVYIRK